MTSPIYSNALYWLRPDQMLQRPHRTWQARKPVNFARLILDQRVPPRSSGEHKQLSVRYAKPGVWRKVLRSSC